MPSTQLFNFTIEYHSDAEYRQLKQEIYTRHTYYVDFDTPTPYIIDAGAHIGMSTLYFKHLYPDSQILAIEPHPASFALLQKNVTENRLTHVQLLQTALINSNQKSVTLFADEEETWLMSASLRSGAWNGFQEKMIKLTVPAMKLSQLIDRPVDLLKLDIEGGEFEVIADLIQTGTIDQIRRLSVEIHARSGQELERIVTQIEKIGLHLEEPLNRKQIQSRLPSLAQLTFCR